MNAMNAIANKYLQELTRRLQSMGIQLHLPTDLAEKLANQCKNKDGARYLRRLIQDAVEGPLAEYLLMCSKKPGVVETRWEGDGLKIIQK
jgi:ATP-dependent Clp protease ATP-binding subunit ClpA